jgi:MFS transporter, ACS family, hexuronate transporter
VTIRNLRWWIIGTCFLATTINYIDRQCLSVAAPTICKEFHFSNADYSSIVTSFLIAYTIMQGLSGKIIDRIGTRRGMAYSIVWWSAAGMLHVFARGLWGFRLFRFLLGAGEAGNWPAATKVVSEWFPARERSLAVAIFDSGSSLGGVVAPPLVAWLILHYGWRSAFLVTGLLGFLWLFLWLWIYRNPEAHPAITAEELQNILADPDRKATGQHSSIRWASLLGYSQVWGLIAGRMFTDCVWWFYVYWLPKYLSDERGFTLEKLAMTGWIPFLAVDAGDIGGGWLSGYLVRRGWSLNASRKFVMAVASLGMAAGLPAGLTSSAGVCLALVTVATFACAVWGTMMLTLPSDLFPSSVVASVSGLSGTGAGLGGIAFTWLTGVLVDRFSYRPVFIIAGLMPLLAFVLVHILIRNIRRVEIESGGARA